MRGIVTSAFGIRRDPINGNLANHLAIDIAHSGLLGGAMETVGKVKIYKAR